MGARHVAFPIDPVKREKPEKPDTGGTDGGYDGYNPGTSTPTYPGSSYDPGSYDSGSFGGSNSGNSSSGGEKPSVPGDAAGKGKPDKKGGPAKEAIGEFEQAASPTAELPSQSTPLPQTFVFLAGLGALAAALGGGFLWYRRRLP
jgi:hypothetical protein